jgi:type I restriction enzyme R subunit
MKGRGTRKWSFEYNNYSDAEIAIEKDKFKFFDFFASCEYFEKDFPYDEKIKLPEFTKAKEGPKDPNDPPTKTGPIDLDVLDPLQSVSETAEGVIMRIDREGFKTKVAPDVASDPVLAAMWANGDISAAEAYVKENVFDKPADYLNLEKVRRIFNVDRKISVKELLEVIFGEKESFDMKDDLLESEWERFMTIHKVGQDYYQPVKNFFKAFLVDEEVRDIVKTKEFARFYHCASFDFSDYERLNGFKDKVPQYIRDYAPGLVGV